MTRRDPNRWLRRYHPAPPGAPRLVCFPFAGGSASYFHPMSAALPDTEVVSVQYPGRQDRLTEPPLRDLHAIADAVVAELPDDATPTVLFGHSMGALVGYEVARRLEARGTHLTHLYVSGWRAPGRRRPGGPVHELDDAGVLADVRTLGGPGSELLDVPEAARMLLPTVRGDYAAVELYDHEPGTPLRCALTAMTGDSDPLVSPAEAREWAEQTSGRFDLRVFPGAHFYLTEHAADVLATIRESL